MDKGGSFLGTVRVLGGSRPFNLGPALLESGLAKLHPNFDTRVAGGQELVAAQELAQSSQLKVGFCPRLTYELCLDKASPACHLLAARVSYNLFLLHPFHLLPLPPPFPFHCSTHNNPILQAEEQ